MVTDEDQAIEDDIDGKELLQEIFENGQDSELTRLTEMVRKHYINYLEKQLHENLINSNYNSKRNGVHKDDYNEMCKKSIKKTAELLEDKAVKACMIAKLYQRAMVKIIAIVRRTTEERRILTQLEKCIQAKDECKPSSSSKETQTELGLPEEALNCNKTQDYNESFNINLSVCSDDDKNNISLDEKIEIFKQHLQKENCVGAVNKYQLNNKQKKSKRHQKHHNEPHSYRAHYRDRQERNTRRKVEVNFSPASSIITAPNTPISPTSQQQVTHSSLVENKEPVVVENENSNDSVGLELARLFSEEKTELDEIFGIDPNDEPDDPQICKILKEIEEAEIIDGKTSTSTATQCKVEKTQPEPEPKKLHEQCINVSLSIDLSKSIWPCELFMQRRKLSESLARLIEEDLRWHDIIKWKFSELFGEDSDNEFTPCSPSIELNEVLIGSCIRRISPWVVKYLMKPMRDGLIGNRFLFKKLAKNLARSIIINESQYPDEAIIQEYVENFFCLHQAVMSLEDLDVNMPSITTSF